MSIDITELDTIEQNARYVCSKTQMDNNICVMGYTILNSCPSFFENVPEPYRPPAPCSDISTPESLNACLDGITKFSDFEQYLQGSYPDPRYGMKQIVDQYVCPYFKDTILPAEIYQYEHPAQSEKTEPVSDSDKKKLYDLTHHAVTSSTT